MDPTPSGAEGAAGELAHLSAIQTTTESGAFPSPPAEGASADEPSKEEPPKEDTSEEEASKSEDDDPSEKDLPDPEEKPEPKSRVRWTEDGGFEVKRGDETITLSEDEVARIARKRIGKAHEQARDARGELAKEREARLRLERDLAEARARAAEAPKPQTPEWVDPKKPWTAKGAEKPRVDDFEDVDAWADARDEWKDAQAKHAEAPDAEPTKEPAEEPKEGELTDEQRQQLENWAKQAREFNKAALEKYGEDYQELVIDNDEAPFSPIMVDLVREVADDPAAVLIALGRDLEVANEIATHISEGRGPKAVKALASVEAGITREPEKPTTGDEPPAERKPSMKPPKPGAHPRRSPADLAERSTEDYYAWRKEQGW